MRIRAIRKIHLDEPIPVYDVINAAPNHNFFVSVGGAKIVSHNCFLDEVSFARNSDVKRQMEKAKVVFDAALERIESRFTKFGGVFNGLIIMASSKRTDQAFAEVYAEQLVKGKYGSRVMVVDRPRWEVLPPGTYSGKTFPVALGDKLRPSEIIEEKDVQKYKEAGYEIIYPPIETYDRFATDMMSALTNIAGRSVSMTGQFIAGQHIGACTNPNIKNPFRESVIYVGTKDKEQYYDYFDASRMTPEDRQSPLYIHIDASLGEDGNTISGGRILYAQDQMNEASGLVEPELHFRQLFKVKVRAPKGDKTMLRKNTQFILWLRQQGFKIAKVSSDQFQSVQMGQDLIAAGIPYTYQSIDRVEHGVNKKYQLLRTTIYEHRVELLDDDDQREELLHLVKYEDGRVDKPSDGSYQDDASQCLCGWVNLAAADKEAYVMGHTVLAQTVIGSTSMEEAIALQTTLPPEFTRTDFLNEFGAYRVEQKSHLRTIFDSTMYKEAKEDKDTNKPSPLNFF